MNTFKQFLLEALISESLVDDKKLFDVAFPDPEDMSEQHLEKMYEMLAKNIPGAAHIKTKWDEVSFEYKEHEFFFRIGPDDTDWDLGVPFDVYEEDKEDIALKKKLLQEVVAHLRKSSKAFASAVKGERIKKWKDEDEDCHWYFIIVDICNSGAFAKFVPEVERVKYETKSETLNYVDDPEAPEKYPEEYKKFVAKLNDVIKKYNGRALKRTRFVHGKGELEDKRITGVEVFIGPKRLKYGDEGYDYTHQWATKDAKQLKNAGHFYINFEENSGKCHFDVLINKIFDENGKNIQFKAPAEKAYYEKFIAPLMQDLVKMCKSMNDNCRFWRQS